MKSIALYLLILLSFLNASGQPNEGLLFRSIGHSLLLNAGDSTSRVLPIKELGNHTYLIEFESDFPLNPDTLIQVIQRHLAHQSVKNEYRVVVFNCKQKDIVYGYEVTKNNDFSIPCTGRLYPKACYKIQIQLLEIPFPWKTTGISIVAILLALGFVFYKKKKTFSNDNLTFTPLGEFQFFSENKFLIFHKERIVLSEKETKLLLLFTETPNQIIDRDTLLKEVWENDGVFVISRNLDVLVSKLRKKLLNDPNIKIINSHGKGYGLEIQK